MATSALRNLYCVNIDPDVLSGTEVILKAVGRQMIRSGLQVQQEATSGAMYATHQSVYAGAPMAEFQSKAIAQALDCVGLTGLAIAAASQSGLTAYGQARSQGSGRASGSAHDSYNMKEGLLLPRRLSCQHQGDMVLDLEALITWDGTNAPIVPAEGVALPTLAVDDQRFSIGACQIGTVTGDKLVVAQIQNFDLDYGINASAEGSDSDVFPTYATINDIARPELRLTLSTQILKSSGGIPLAGKEIDLSHTVFFARKRSRSTSSGFVADATAEHISFVPASGLAYVDQVFEASNSGVATTTIVICFISTDGTTHPLTMDTTAAIALPA